MYIETSTTELSINAGSSDTAELRFTRPFGAIRVTVVTNDATEAAITLGNLDRVLVELPNRGGLSRRLNLSGAEVNMLPLVTAIGGSTSDEAAMTSSYALFTTTASAGASQTLNYSYFDLPVGAKANEEMRMTFEVAAGASSAYTFRFSALENVADRNLIFDVSSMGTGTRVDHTFRNDVAPFAMIVGSGLISYEFDATNATNRGNLTEINFDGLPRFTYDDMHALNCELDQVITSSVTANSRDAQVVDCVFAQVPAGVKKCNIEASGAAETRWVIVAYLDTVGVVA